MKESFISRALENLQAAELLFENELYNASANRAYYSAFHSAIAAIYYSGTMPIIDHKTVQSLFSDLFVNRRKILSSKYKGYLYDLQNIRNLADYGNGINRKKSKECLTLAQEFYDVIFGVLNENQS